MDTHSLLLFFMVSLTLTDDFFADEETWSAGSDSGTGCNVGVRMLWDIPDISCSIENLSLLIHES